MAAHISALAVLVTCIMGFTASVPNETTTEVCDSGLNDRIDKLETLLTEHFKDFRVIANQEATYRDCLQVYKRGWKTSGLYAISPDGKTKMDVYCEQELDGGGWTVFQNREDGSVDFFRDWDDYKSGFGNLNGEFWLGNDKIHLLTQKRNQKLKVELKSPGGQFAYADYGEFWNGKETDQYKLHMSEFSGAAPPGDSMQYHDGQGFSTKDSDNDPSTAHCAQVYHGAWWYDDCHFSNLNGLYGNTTFALGLLWQSWTGYYVSMAGSRMMVKKILK